MAGSNESSDNPFGGPADDEGSIISVGSTIVLDVSRLMIVLDSWP
jgi:hypothetical protein